MANIAYYRTIDPDTMTNAWIARAILDMSPGNKTDTVTMLIGRGRTWLLNEYNRLISN